MIGSGGVPPAKGKASISEDDVSTVLQRYPPGTLLTLLQEVANSPGVKIDWKSLVKKTSTGISNAREYQMLWRHLAYHDDLLEKLEDDAEPLDDDSDLEVELETTPVVNQEAVAEAAACVKVLIASGSPSDLAVRSNLADGTPLSKNVPNGQSSRGHPEKLQTPSSMQGTKIPAPASVQKQPLPVPSARGLDGNLPPKKKRKLWSKDEDLELIAAVQKYGEGSWANILKGEFFKGDRTASQLSQRWAIIRKRQKNLNVGDGTLTGTQLSEAKLAANHALSLALGPAGKNLTSGIGNKQAQNQSQPALVPPKPSPAVDSNTMMKSVVSIKISPSKTEDDPDSMGIKAAAVAAGARIATASDAASLMMAAQAKKAVHIIPSGGGSAIKRAISGGSAISGAFPNVHFIRTGLSNPALSSQAAIASTTMRTGPMKPNSATVRSSPTVATTQADGKSIGFSKPPSDQECQPKGEIQVSGLASVQEDGARESDNTMSPSVDERPIAPQLQTQAESSEKKVNNAEEAMEDDSVSHNQTTVYSDPAEDETQLVCMEITEEATSVDGKCTEKMPGLVVDKEKTEVQVLS